MTWLLLGIFTQSLDVVPKLSRRSHLSLILHAMLLCNVILFSSIRLTLSNMFATVLMASRFLYLLLVLLSCLSLVVFLHISDIFVLSLSPPSRNRGL